jgi:hypothetical protein
MGNMKNVCRIFFLSVLVLLIPVSLHATPQIPDTVIYNHTALSWHGEGLSPILQSQSITFIPPHTACWDGHIVKWEIRDKKLFLVNLAAWIRDDTDKACGRKKVGMGYLFPGKKEVFADWFSGDMVLMESETGIIKDLTVDCIYRYLVFKNGVMTRDERKTETFDMNDRQQMGRYYFLFKKSPTR